jgi:hypothetical protein
MKRAVAPSILVVVVLVAVAVIAEPQQPAKVRRIGVLRADSSPARSPYEDLKATVGGRAIPIERNRRMCYRGHLIARYVAMLRARRE